MTNDVGDLSFNLHEAFNTIAICPIARCLLMRSPGMTFERIGEAYALDGSLNAPGIRHSAFQNKSLRSQVIEQTVGLWVCLVSQGHRAL